MDREACGWHLALYGLSSQPFKRTVVVASRSLDSLKMVCRHTESTARGQAVCHLTRKASTLLHARAALCQCFHLRLTLLAHPITFPSGPAVSH